ncbi:MAG: hypothetical protein AVDCRST_MAG95-1866 [uncultured Adhaeribacter sp.]|uniref:Dystroglycan-type cadherin-like domain-containing protein n=1 Tax=uncultured Adhaeribacter sp. TaxID=448109 RepID=A0A6J4II26_9BACT|nr:MAG: hypothetical protein AVDCRST_MAG95-1866 [uncultured Adhaeribacter sp.]
MKKIFTAVGKRLFRLTRTGGALLTSGLVLVSFLHAFAFKNLESVREFNYFWLGATVIAAKPDPTHLPEYSKARPLSARATGRKKEFLPAQLINVPVDPCYPISTLGCDQIAVSLPLRLNFEGSAPQSLPDKNNVGTGFTMANTYSGTRLAADGTLANPNIPGFDNSKLTLTNGTLKLLTNKGIAYTNNNNQINALGVKVDTRGRLVIETKILSPYSGSQGQQAGLWFGLHDKTYLKLVVSANKVELRREVNDVSPVADQRITSTLVGNIQTLRLRLVIDPATNTAEGFYALNGVTYLNAGAKYTTKTLSLAGTGLTGSSAYAGIFATHRSATTPVTYTFDDFAVTPNKAPVVVQAPTDQMVPANQLFLFSAGQYADLDVQDVLTYTARLANGSALPSWLKFNSSNLTFSGTTPSVRTSLPVTVTATDPEKKTVSATFTFRVNSAPVLSQPLADRIINNGQEFSFTAGQFSDADAGDVLSYSAILADSSAWPEWLVFNGSNGTFSGTAPSGNFKLAIKLTATDQLLAAVSDTFSLETNHIPTIVQTPVDQLLPQGKSFSFSAGQYTDVDPGDVLTYQATLSNGSALPAWLQFNSTSLTFSGTAPNTQVTYIVKVTATDSAQAAVSATLQVAVRSAAEVACFPISPLPCNELGVSLPFVLDFAGSEVGLTDVNGLGTGFTMADAYSGTRLTADGSPADADVRGHQPSKLTLINNTLKLVTNKGIAYLNNNNQINALGVQVNSRNLLVIETTIINPYNGSAGQQGGIMFSLNDKTFVKLVIIGSKVELRKEVNDVSAATAADQRLTGSITGLSNKTVRLRLVLNPAANTAEGFYSMDGSSFLNTGAGYATASLNLTNTGLINSTGYAGIFATHRNASTPVTYTFDEFKISPSLVPANQIPMVVQAPVNQVFGSGQIFAFSAGEYTDLDTADVLTYTATLADGEALPAWLVFNPNNLPFSGKAPAIPGTFGVKVTATDPKQAAVTALFDIEVQDTEPVVACVPISTLPCDRIVKSQSVKLTFDGNIANSITDKNGNGIGFTMVNTYSGTRLAQDGTPTFAPVPGYEPAKLTLSNGKLQIATNKGIALQKYNNQINALGVRIDNHGKLIQIETTLINPYKGTSGQQAGLWLGLHDKTAVRLAISANKLELRREIKDVSGANTTDQRITAAISGLDAKTVCLRMIVDLAANTAEGFYSTNGTTFISVGNAYDLKSLSVAGMGLKDSTVYGGIYASHRSAITPVTYTFEDFTLESTLRPYVTAVRPADGFAGVALDQSVSVDLTYPSGKSINGNTVNPNTVKLYTVAVGGGTEVTGTAVNATAAGDAITLSAPLQPSTTYEFSITDLVKDGNGLGMIPFTSRFTTAGNSELPPPIEGVAFDEVTLVDTTFGTAGFTSLVVGPDRRLYAATSEGKIERWDIKADGSITNHVTINLFGLEKRLLIGFHFDPTAKTSNLIAWITHSSGVFYDAPNWSGKISKIDITDPANPYLVDYVVNLPRSFKDHSTNSIDFGTDGALYLVQGSNSAMGAPDGAWGNRPETLLTAAVLRLDLTQAQTRVLPIDAKTEGPAGTYNPYLPDAPLTIYATGVRNAYDLVWHSNGALYVPTNGSAAGGNTPALINGAIWSDGTAYTGPSVPALKDIRQSLNDYLFKIEKGGYYGHPNVLRREYILNGGNPTARQDPGEVAATSASNGYPEGTPTEPNYKAWSYDFGLNISPNGVIEYKSNVFGGKLKGKLLVCRFSGGDDIMILEPSKTDKNIIQATEGIKIPGFRRPFANPLDIAEDPLNGNLYLSEYYDGNGDGWPRLTLLKVKETAAPQPEPQTNPIVIDTKKGPDSLAAGNEHLNVFPNPNTGNQFQISLKHYASREAVKISIYNMAGRFVQTKTLITDEKGTIITELKLANKLGPGVYFVRAQAASGVNVKKLLVQ